MSEKRHYVALSLVPSIAASATIVAPPLSPYDPQIWYCIILNVTDKPIEVEVTQFDTAGTPLPTFQITTQPFQPFGAFDATAAKVGGSCRVSFKGGKDDVRAHICIFEPDKGCTVIVPAR